MAEAIVPRDRSGLLLRLLFLTALLGVGAGVFFKTTNSQAATNDFVVAITDSADPVSAGESFTYTVDLSDGAGTGVAAGSLVVYIRFDPTGANRAIPNADYVAGDASDANWECSELMTNLVGCTSTAIYAPTDAIPDIIIPIDVAQGAVNGRVIRITANVNSLALPGAVDSNDAEQLTTIANVSDLGIAKDDVVGTVLAGANITFPVTVTNYGPANATNVTVTDVVPAGLTLNAAAAGFNPGGGFACTATGTVAGSTITCAIGLLGANQSASMDLPFTVAANQGAGAIVNTASVADNVAVDVYPDSDTGSVTVGASTNYGVTKVASDDNVSAGDSFTYTLSATLSGATLPSAATVTDSLTGVAGLGYTVTPGAGWNCLPLAGVTTGNDAISCTTAAPLGQGTHQVAVITIGVPADAQGGSISNSAAITGPNADPVPGNNNVGPVVVNITTQVDIDINKCAVAASDVADDCAASISQIQASTGFVYRILVDNLGPSNAPAGTVSVGDSLPTNVVFTGNPQVNDLSPAAAGWSCTPVVLNTTPASVTCTNTSDVIDAGTGVYIDLPVAALPVVAAGTQVCNAASANVSPQLIDVDMTNNTNPAPGACVTVVTISDLGVTKTASTAEIVPGGLITYSIVVTNAGPSAAVSPYLSDDLTSSGTKLVSMVAPAGWTCLKSPANTALTVGYAGLIVCQGPASFPVGGSAVFSLTVQSDILAVGGADTIANTAWVNLPGPANQEFLCPQAAAGDPEDVPADATCQGLPDSGTATVEVLEYDMVVAKTATPANDPQSFNPAYIPGSVFAGDSINYTVGVINIGPDVAPAGAVSLGDGRDNPLKLQGTLDLTGAPQFNPSCVVGPDNPPQFNKSFTCNNQGGEFDPNSLSALATIAYTADVVPTTPAGTLVCNSATVTVNPFGADTTLDNNEFEICNTVVTASDLTVIKSGPPSAQANGTLAYSIVVSNLGPQAALGPVLYETVPADTTFQSITAPLGWACYNDATNAPLTTGLPAGTVIRCNGPQTFSFPGTAVFTYIVKVVASPAGTTIENNTPVTVNQVVFGEGACIVPGTENFVDANGNFGEINDDLDLANNCDQESTPLYVFSELLVLKTALNPLVAGQGQLTNTPPHDAPAIYRIEVKNTGPNVATNLTFQDLLPAGVSAYGVAPVLEYISGSTSTVNNQATLDAACGTYDGLAGTDSCSLGNLAVGMTLKFNIRVALAPDLLSFPEEDCNGLTTTEPGVQVCNRATFTSDSFDYSMFTNYGVLAPISEFDDDKQTVATSSDLVITKTNTAGAATCSGDTCAFTYIVSVDNLGPSDTTAPVQFTDFFPANLSITAVDLTAAPGWFCETLPANPAPNGNDLVDVPLATPATVVCSSNPNNVAVADATAVIEFDVNVLSTALTGSTLVNNVCLWTNGTVPAPINDPVIANNCVTDTIGVNNGNVITGTKYIDLNGNGDPSEVETGVGAGFEIFIDDGRDGGTANDGIKNGGEVSATTNASGVYTISNLIGGGPWRVCETPKTGYTQTGVDIDSVLFTPDPVPPVFAPGVATEVDLGNGQTCVDVTFQVSSAPTKTASGVDFLNFQNFSITGFKFEDVNGNGNGDQEQNESGVDTPDFTLYVDYNNNGILDSGEPSSTQIPGFPTGDYKISNVGPCAETGNVCYVREVRTAGWIQTYPNFGVANPPFTDANGVPLYPYDPDQSNPLNQANSAAHAVPVPAVAGAEVGDYDFSNFKLVAISGIKFNDLDADGLPREAGEPLLGGFKICWDYDGTNGCTATDPEVPTTDADGTYTILVGPGTSFDICENLQTSPSGWTATYPVDDSVANCHVGITADSGDVIQNINFGNFQNIVQGFKWNDREDPLTDPVTPPDGAWDIDGVDNVLGTPDDEVGLAGWLICAIPVDEPDEDPDCNPNREYTATTDVNGFYQILDLPGGTTYRICEAPKTGWVQTHPGNDNCHTLTIGSGSGPVIADHIFGVDYPHNGPEAFNFGNNSPLPPVDMSVVKTAPSTVVVNSNLDFTFAVTNNSAYPAVNVALTDTVNPLLTTTYVGTISPTPGAWSCSFAAGVLDCVRTGDMPANSSETVKVRFTASATPTEPNAIPNEVCVTADNPDPSTGNNCSTTNPGTVVSSAPVNPPSSQADLRLDKAASPITAPQQLGPNVYIDYRVRVRNLGPGVASFVKVTDVLTSGLKYQSMSNSGSYSCTTPAVGSTGTVTCTKASVNLNASNTIVFKVRTPNPVPQDGGGPNQAMVEQCTDNTYTTCSTSLNDPNPNNNVGQAQASLP